jgi:HEAT repeat protein
MALFAKEPAKGREDIANTWAEIGSSARAAVPLLVELLSDHSPALRLAAARALLKIEERPERVVPTLIAIVKSDGKSEDAAGRDPSGGQSPQANAAELLGLIGPEAHRAVPALLEATRGPDRVLCDCAIEALGKIGLDAKEAIPAIVERLGDNRQAHQTYGHDIKVGTTALIALGKMGPDAAIGLIPALNRHDKEVRQQAALALKELGPHAVFALDPLVAALRDPDEDVRRYAAYAIGGIGSAAQSALPALLKVAKDPSSRVREKVADALPLIAPKSPQVVAALIAALEDSDGTVQAHAIMSLGKLDEAARPAVPLMANMLGSEKEYLTSGHPVTTERLSDCVASALGELGSVANEAVPALVKAASEGTHANWELIPAIGKIGPGAKAALPFLLREATPEAAIAVVQIDPDNAEIIPILRQAWQSTDSLQYRHEMYPDRSWCYVLGRFGARAKPAIPTLERLLNAPNNRCRMAAALTVLEIDPTHKRALDVCVGALRQRSLEFPEVGPIIMGDFLEPDVEQRLDRLMIPLGLRARAFVPTLCEILTNPGFSARISAGERLAAIGPVAEEAVPSLIRALGRRDPVFSPNEDLPSKAAEALARIGPAAVPSLIQALKDDHFLVRAGAADALGRMGPRACLAVFGLVDALGDERMIVRASAAMALKKLGTSTGPVVTSLARVLRDEYCLVRHNAAEALGETEPADKTVTNAIVEATRDDSLFVRDAAQATLRKIEMRSLRQR